MRPAFLAAVLGGAQFDVYVDSVNGSDANPGTSLGSALQTLAAAASAMSAGKKLALVSGSQWREQFSIAWDNITLGVAGAGAPPIISAADVVTATWTKPDVLNFPDVWSISWTRSHTPAATDDLLLWADGVLQTHRNSLSELQSLGGWRASGRIANPATVYIKSVADPNTSGVVYELPKRATAIGGHDQQGYNGDFAAIVGPIEALRSGQNYGPVAGGSGSQSRLLVRDGGLHHLTSEAATVEDVIALGIDQRFPTPAYPLTAYRANSVGFAPTWKRSFVLADGNPTTANIGIYCHASAPSGNAEACTVEQAYVTNMQTAVSLAADVASIDGLYSQNCNYPVANGQPLNTVNRMLARSTVTGGVIIALRDGGPVNNDSLSRTVENSVLYSAPGTFLSQFATLSARNGSLTIRNCIIFVDTPDEVNSLIFRTAGGGGAITITMEYCVIVRLKNTGSLWRTLQVDAPATIVSDHNIWLGFGFVDNTLGGTNYRSLASWKAAGYDANSVHLYTGFDAATVLSTYFQGNPANGDFRLKAGLGTFTDGVSLNLAGPQSHWDWNARAPAAGAPTQWPVPPANLAESRTYIADPEAWDFYP